jgi:hypothetical protein
MTKPTTIPEAVEACADWSHPLPHPDTSHIIKSTFPAPAQPAPRRRICWPCVGIWSVFGVWVGLALSWLWIVIAGNY